MLSFIFEKSYSGLSLLFVFVKYFKKNNSKIELKDIFWLNSLITCFLKRARE